MSRGHLHRHHESPRQRVRMRKTMSKATGQMVLRPSSARRSHRPTPVNVYFTDFFNIRPSTLRRYGALDISLVSDLPVFIDPFLLFGSNKCLYKKLHDEMIRYLVFLRGRAAGGGLEPALIKSWYAFKEVHQLWLGFTQRGNRGSGLGENFAQNLHTSLHDLFRDFGKEKVTKSSHLEKVCLIRKGVGNDRISDFTARLILDFLCTYTQTFARRYLARHQRKYCVVDRVRFDYKTERWMPARFELPYWNGDHVLLTPRDILTRYDTWINRDDLLERFDELPPAIPNAELRAAVVNYFMNALPKVKPNDKDEDREPTKAQRKKAASATIERFPQVIDYYIRNKEDHPAEAQAVSDARVAWTEQVFIKQIAEFARKLAAQSSFYRSPHNTLDEARERLLYLKQVVENQDGYRIFYDPNGQPIKREKDIQILYQLVWFGSPSDVNREANNGRGPVDFAISRGARDKSLVEFKLASNTALRRNLERQLAIYEKANQTMQSIKAIVFFSLDEEYRVKEVLKDLGLDQDNYVVLIDARRDNKPSGSKA